MGFDVSSLVGKTVEATVEIAGETATVYYDPNVLTKARIQASEEGDNDFIAYFCELVKDWDVTEGGVKVPLKPEALEPLPIVLLRKVFWTILRDSSSGEMGKVSNAPSSRRVPRDRMAKKSSSRSGTGTSRSRATSK